jgi:hypothetical protein
VGFATVCGEQRSGYMQPRIGKWALRSGFPKDEIPALAAQYAVGHSVESLIEIGHRSKATGFYMPDDFSVICRSARNNRNCDVNSARKIEKETRISLSTNSEQERVYSLMRLSGVSWSTAQLRKIELNHGFLRPKMKSS